MSVFNAAVVEGRAWAESLMLDTCMVQEDSGLTAQDPVTGDELPIYNDLFPSPCKIQQASRLGLIGQISRPDVGGRKAAIVRMSVHLPIALPQPVRAGLYVLITAIGAKSDPQILNRRFRLVSPVHKSLATSLRFEIEEVTA